MGKRGKQIKKFKEGKYGEILGKYEKRGTENNYLIWLPGHDDVCVLHGGCDVSIVGRLHVVLVLLHHPVYVPAPLADVTLQPPRQPHIRVRFNKHLKTSFVDRCRGWKVKFSRLLSLKINYNFIVVECTILMLILLILHDKF